MQQGLFYPELVLGAEALSDGRRREICDFFVRLVRQRDFPLHVANLWNALYFSWDLDERGYAGATINPDRIPCRQMNERDFSLPIGGFIRIQTATRVDELWTEVVYKEWERPEILTDFVPPGFSGMPAVPEEFFAGEQVAVVPERFVLDLNAFGPDFNDLTPKRYERLLRRGRWLDENSHLMLESMYTRDEVELEDIDHYVYYLLNYHRDGLLAFCFREEPREEELREGLLRSFDAVRELAASCRELDCWRDKYFFDRADYEQCCYNEGSDAIFGTDDLSTIFRSLVQLPQRKRVSYTAIGPRILEVLERGGFEDHERALVRGPAYGRVLCYANVYVRNRLREEAPEGLLAEELHLRLDDDRQAGGIWRCERVSKQSSLMAIPPTLPLGLGYSETHKEAGYELVKTHPEPFPISMHSFSVALTKRDITYERLRLPERVASTLGASREIGLRLRHGEEQDTQTVRFEREGKVLIGIGWPLSFYPGLLLHCNAESGGTVVKVRTKEQAQPKIIDGVELRYAFNEAVYRRDIGEQRLSSGELRRAPVLNDLIHRAFRNRGRLMEDGGRALTGTEIVDAILGPDWKPGESRAITIALQRLGLEYRDGEYVWQPRITHRTSVFERTLLTAYGEEQPRRRLYSIVCRHWVPMHLRRLATWQEQPHPSKIKTYAEALRRNGRHGVLPPELPPGYTWVEPHKRGSREEENVLIEPMQP